MLHNNNNHNNSGVRLTCGIERAFVHAVNALVQQAHRLVHIVGRAHGRAGGSARLLHETQDVPWRDNLSTNSIQTPGRERTGKGEACYSTMGTIVTVV